MAVKSEMKRKLGEFIIDEIKVEFERVHLSMNLVNTLNLYQAANGNWVVEIPADIYDIELFRRDGVIIYTGEGSYANRINASGGFSGYHKDYVTKCISKAIDKWKLYYNMKAVIK